MKTHWTQNCNKIKSSTTEKANVVKHENEDQIGCISQNVKPKFNVNNYDIYYDTCATIGVIKDKILLSNIKTIPAKNLTGVGGQTLSITQQGFLDPFGIQLYSKDAKFNIISHENIISNFYVYYNNQTCE
jgi:hypothetical protein